MNTAAVIVSRNDNYGDNLVHRAAHCLLNASNTFDHVFYVDWKSASRSLTDEIENLPSNITTIKITRDTILKKWPHSINIPVVETIGRNIGIRAAINAGAQWICSTNIDVIINPFSVSELDKDTLYTARRRNVPIDRHINITPVDWKAGSDLCNNIKESLSQAQIAAVNGVGVWDAGDHWSLVVCCGDFQLAHADLWNIIRGFEEEMIGRCYADSNLMKRPILIGKKTSILDAVDVFHLDHGSASFREPGEYLPINDQNKYVATWEKSSNTKDWGLYE